MDYQVWTKDEYTAWQKVDCGDLPAAQRVIMEALKAVKEPLLIVVVPFDVSIKIKEDKIGEATKSKAKPDKGAGVESASTPGRGDTAATSKVNS